MNKNFKSIRQIAVFSGIWAMLLAGAGIGYFIGDFLDKKFKTHGILLFVFVMLGVAAGFREMFFQIKKQKKVD